eukprot:52099_1
MVKNNIAFWVSVVLASIYLNLYECKRDSKSKNSPLASTKSDRNIELQGSCKCKGYLQWTAFVLSYPMNVTMWATVNKKVGWQYGPLTLVAGEHEKGPLCHNVCTTPNHCNKKRNNLQGSVWSKVFSPGG